MNNPFFLDSLNDRKLQLFLHTFIDVYFRLTAIINNYENKNHTKMKRLISETSNSTSKAKVNL